ncbi:MAG: hypothetical protein NT137_04495 [Methanomassiliicoccales archaeon]|nr:hypothetical protein [Methanomassiliicoccales archaeon]
MPPLSPRERALLHLYDARREQMRERPSEAITQEGIALALGVNRTHITRTLRPLVDAGLVEQDKGHVSGKERKLIFYKLTEAGLANAVDVIRSIGDEELVVVDSSGRRMTTVRELLALRTDLPALTVADSVGREMRLPPIKKLVTSNAPLRLEDFLGREEQLRTAQGFVHSDATLLAVFANYGYGSSTFMKKLALELWDGHLFWHDLEKESSSVKLVEALRSYASQLGLEGELDRLRNERVLLCFDNYNDVSQENVDVLFDLLQALKGGAAKMAVAMREETPSYNRFYQKRDLVDGSAVEVHVHRFDEAMARRLVGEDIDDEAFQLIYMLTRGQPLALALIKKGDAEELRKIRLSEEVSFLMYLRTRRKAD